MNADRPTVRLDVQSRPETGALVRAMLGGVAEPLAFDPELLDDLKTAVSEACNNVALYAYAGAPGPLTVMLYLGREAIEVIVRDWGCGIPAAAPASDGVGIPVIRALSERSEFRSPADGGTEVWMRFSAQRDGKQLLKGPAHAAPENGWSDHLAGDAVASVSPVTLLTGVMGRLARALAASARFSLDRFSDVYLVTDAIAAHAVRSASADRVAFAVSAADRRLELKVGPFPPRTGAALREGGEAAQARLPLALLSDELDVEPVADHELLRVVLIDHRRDSGRAPEA